MPVDLAFQMLAPQPQKKGIQKKGNEAFYNVQQPVTTNAIIQRVTLQHPPHPDRARRSFSRSEHFHNLLNFEQMAS